MEEIKTPIDDLILINPSVYKDERGEFLESYNDKKTIDKLKNRVGSGKLLRVEDLQFLETIYENY